MSPVMSSNPLYDVVASTLDKALSPSLKSTLQPLVKWQPGVSPLSTNTTVTCALAAYLGTIFGIQAMMKESKPKHFRHLFMVHNVLLSSASALLLGLMLEELVPIIWKHGFFYGICSPHSWTPTYYIINYMFKYWEFADTVFLVFKKKQLQFLHVFHHAATALLCYTQLNGKTSVSWAVISLNLLVHVIMYYYYFITTLSPGIKLWWKKYLTTLQISQFIIDLFVVYFASGWLFLPRYFSKAQSRSAYSYFAYNYSNLPSPGSCSGTEGAAIFGCLLLTSYLVLFIAFYRKTYKKGAAAPASKAAKTVQKKIE